MSGEPEKNTEPQALREVLEGLSIRSNQAKTDDDADGDKKHAFWDTQPVPPMSKPPHLALIADIWLPQPCLSLPQPSPLASIAIEAHACRRL